MEEKEFLKRISSRLGRPTPQAPPPSPPRGVPEFHRASREAQAGLALRFKTELERVGGSVFLEQGSAAAMARLKALLEEWKPKRTLTWAKEEFKSWDLDWLFALPETSAWTAGAAQDAAYKERVLSADLGISCADFGIADTGSLLVSAGPGRPRAFSLAPSAHLALLKARQLVPDMGAALETFPIPPSALTFITGPSRTSDIENDSTIGVHGPASLTVIIEI
jgi:L-lactate dehydrogenase complex protein LldG